QIVGFINVREFLTNHISKEISETNEFIHELPVITEVSRISDALVKMQRERVHIALIIDEYGGTAGIITMDAILEEIVGEIRDEFDEDEEPDIVKVEDDIYHISGRVLLDTLEEEFGIEFEESEDIDTIGGWLQSIDPNIQANSYVNTKNDKWIVLDVENHTINKVAFLRNYNRIETDDVEIEED